MNDPRELLETGWRRQLTASEEAELEVWLAAHPEAQLDWETESALTKGLVGLPDVPVATNFTTRVLQEIERKPAPARLWKWKWSRPSLVPKAAILMVALSLGLLISRQQAMARRLELAQSVATVSKVASLPSPEILEDFEVIRRLNFNPPPDEELIALLK
jgi:anti-sigma factor RsiW